MIKQAHNFIDKIYWAKYDIMKQGWRFVIIKCLLFLEF